MSPAPRAITLLLLTLGFLGEPSSRRVDAGENYAFLVGVANYDRKELRPLQFTRSDILELHQVLIESGYDKANIVLMHDDLKQLPDRRYFPEASKIREELKLLLAGLARDDSLIVAFSGHGVQFKGQKQNYFCPADSKLDDVKTLIALSDLYTTLEKCPARQKLLLVDACRDDPQSQLAKARQSVDLESVTRPQTEAVPEGLVALFSCAAGQRSFEDPDLKHGVFFYHVLEGLKGAARNTDNEVTLDDLVSFSRRKTQTFARTSLAAIQTPQQLGNFTGTWVLRNLNTPSRPSPPTPGTPPNKSDPKSITSTTTGMKLVLIPAGEYLRGSPDPDNDASDDQKPQHRVKITNAFYLGQHEVTQGEWKVVMGTEPWKDKEFVKEGTDYPATYVSWDDAQEFLTKLSQKDGRTYRLPTEGEWEYAARGGKSTRYSFGEDESNLGDYAWFDKNAWDIGEKYAHQVGLKKPNPFGLYDMHGNVWEWCGDWYDAAEYAKQAGQVVSDPQGPSGQALFRAVRGGCWRLTPRFCRSAHRDRRTPGHRYSHLGFRVLTVQSGP